MGRIIHIAPLLEPLSRLVPGGAEQGLVTLAQFQASLGFDVAVIAPSGSVLPPEISLIDIDLTPGLLVPMNTSEMNCHSESSLHELLTIETSLFTKIRDYLGDHRGDIALIHNHAYDFYPLFNFNDLGIPLIHSLQLPPLAPWINQKFREDQDFPKHVSYVSVSHSSAAQYQSQVGFTPRVIHYGVDTTRIPFQEADAEGFVWVGRISPEKGLHTAIDIVCGALRQPLTVIGRVYDRSYFDNEITPRLSNPLVTYLGHREHKDVLIAMGKASALVFPIEWDEPFGLVAAESLACGTPVVGYERGALPEIVTHGETGYLVHDPEQLTAALCSVGKLSRQKCRDSSIQNHSLHQFAAQYLREYVRLSPRLLAKMRPIRTLDEFGLNQNC